MGEILEQVVERKQYRFTLDEQEYEKLNLAMALVEQIATRPAMKPDVLKRRAEELVGSVAEKVTKAQPEDLPEWWPEEQRHHVTEDRLTPEQIVEEARASHIWLNAFGCISPTDEFLRDVGWTVINSLNQTYLRTEGIGEPDSRGRRAGESPVVYLRINKS
jgi:hypothetical protein